LQAVQSKKELHTLLPAFLLVLQLQKHQFLIAQWLAPYSFATMPTRDPQLPQDLVQVRFDKDLEL
jgi:hypothetical protein